jgi:hypothetical protein
MIPQAPRFSAPTIPWQKRETILFGHDMLLETVRVQLGAGAARQRHGPPSLRLTTSPLAVFSSDFDMVLSVNFPSRRKKLQEKPDRSPARDADPTDV